MAQDRMEESSAAVKALYGAENPCSIKGAPELGEIMQKFIYSDVNNQVKCLWRKRAADAGGFNCQQHSGRYRYSR